MLCLLCKLKVHYCVYCWTLPWLFPVNFPTCTLYSPVHVQLIIRSPGSIVSIVTRLCTGWSTVQLLAAARDFFLSNCPAWAWDAPSLLFHDNFGLFLPTVKWPRHEADQSPQPGAEFQNEWSCTSVLHSCLHCIYGENFIFYFFILVILCEKDILWSSPWYKCIQSCWVQIFSSVPCSHPH